jgi:hypothetical protein
MEAYKCTNSVRNEEVRSIYIIELWVYTLEYMYEFRALHYFLCTPPLISFHFNLDMHATV